MIPNTQITQHNFFDSGPVMVHSDALNTLRLIPRMRDPLMIADAHIGNILKISDGRSVWIPTFNYSFAHTKQYDIEKDESQVGLISERFRQIAHWRTEIPIFNFSGNGIEPNFPNNSEKFVNPFGKFSLFAKLEEKSGNILWYGAPIDSATILHYVESKGTNPLYRYDKFFTGQVKSSDAEKTVTLKFHVRPKDRYLEYDWPKLINEALDSQVIRRRLVEEQGDIFTSKATELVSFWSERYSQDPFYFLDSKSKKWVQPLIEKIGRRFEIQDFEENTE